MYKNKNDINMQKSSKPKRRRFLFVLLAIGILIAASVIVWALVIRHTDPTNKYSPKYAVQSSKDQSSSSGGTSQSVKDPGSDSATTSVTSDQVPAAASGSISIVDLEQANGYINAKASVTNFPTTQCVYSFTATNDANNPIVRQLDGQCDGVSISQVEFQYLGTYTLTVTAYNGTTEKISATKDINVQ